MSENCKRNLTVSCNQNAIFISCPVHLSSLCAFGESYCPDRAPRGDLMWGNRVMPLLVRDESGINFRKNRNNKSNQIYDITLRKTISWSKLWMWMMKMKLCTTDIEKNFSFDASKEEKPFPSFPPQLKMAKDSRSTKMTSKFHIPKATAEAWPVVGRSYLQDGAHPASSSSSNAVSGIWKMLAFPWENGLPVRVLRRKIPLRLWSLVLVQMLLFCHIPWMELRTVPNGNHCSDQSPSQPRRLMEG